jgi:hypothetical protein
MSEVLTNVKVYLDRYDISGFLNSVKLDYAATALNDTRMGHTTTVNKGGVKTVNLAIAGFGDPASAGMEAIAYDRIGTANLPVTASPLGGAPGDVGYFFQALKVTMSAPFANHGELAPYAGTATTSEGPLVRGKVFVSDATAKTASGTSGILQLGDVGATERVYAALHVLAVSGTNPTLDVTVRSDDLVGFATPTTRLTFTQATAPTSQLLTSALGVTTDAFWRVDYTIGGTDTPSFLFVVIVGIL